MLRANARHSFVCSSGSMQVAQQTVFDNNSVGAINTAASRRHEDDCEMFGVACRWCEHSLHRLKKRCRRAIGNFPRLSHGADRCPCLQYVWYLDILPRLHSWRLYLCFHRGSEFTHSHVHQSSLMAKTPQVVILWLCLRTKIFLMATPHLG